MRANFRSPANCLRETARELATDRVQAIVPESVTGRALVNDQVLATARGVALARDSCRPGTRGIGQIVVAIGASTSATGCDTTREERSHLAGGRTIRCIYPPTDTGITGITIGTTVPATGGVPPLGAR